MIACILLGTYHALAIPPEDKARVKIQNVEISKVCNNCFLGNCTPFRFYVQGASLVWGMFLALFYLLRLPGYSGLGVLASLAKVAATISGKHAVAST